jgi:hypothetical protein
VWVNAAEASFLKLCLRLQKSWRLGNVELGTVRAYALCRRELVPTQVLKNCPLDPNKAKSAECIYMCTYILSVCTRV